MPLVRAKAEPVAAAGRDNLEALRAAIDARSAETFVRLLIDEANALTREGALTHLARLDGEFPPRALVRLMCEADTPLRNAAIETLGALGERAIDALAQVLAEGGVDARIYAMTALQQIESPRVAEIALSAARRDTDANVCAAAIEVIAESGVAAMAGALDEIAARFPDRPYLAFAVQAAQRQLG